MHHEKQRTILNFWFGEDPLKPLQNEKTWFTRDSQTDDLITELFEADLLAAETGAYEDWPKTRDGALALVVLCDQFPRHIYRGTERAFSFDAIALRAAQIAVDHHFDQKMNPIERCFLYLPYEHSEDPAVQERSVELFSALLQESHGSEHSFIAGAYDYAIRHRDIIHKFGRFPHRNDMLGRESTKKEREFLRRPGSSF